MSADPPDAMGCLVAASETLRATARDLEETVATT